MAMTISSSPLLLLMLLLVSCNQGNCVRPNRVLGSCSPKAFLQGKEGKCNTINNSECCASGQKYPQFSCSPPTTSQTKARMTINSFAEGADGGGASACDGKFHGDNEMVVALSTGWFDGGSRCGNNIKISANGKTVLAKVVDHCDSVNGCDSEHDFQPPCPNNIVDASKAVWKALQIPESEIGDAKITWADAN